MQPRVFLPGWWSASAAILALATGVGLLQARSGGAGASAPQGESPMGSSVVTNPTWPTPSPPTARIDVDATQVVRVVDDRMFGLNTAVWDGAFNNAETESLLRAIDVRTLRFPGGSTSDTYDWQTNRSYRSGTRILNSWSWATSFDDFARTTKAVGAQGFITVNYGSGTAQQAADWVKYSNVTKAYGFKYWEIGNECYGSWEEDLHASKQDPFIYANEAADYLTRMKAVDPTIKVGIVLIDGEDSYAKTSFTAVTNPRTGIAHRGWTPLVLARMKVLGVTPDFVVYHRYPYGPGSESDANLLSGSSQGGSTWADDAAGLRAQLTDYLGATEGSKVEMVVTESNCVYSEPGKQSTSVVNALFLVDSIGRLLQTEFNAFMWWCLRNGPQDKTRNNASSLEGWRNYGDYGIVAPGNATETPVSAPYPTYYIWKLLSRFARGGDQVVTATTDDPLVACYAARRADGTLSLLVINKSPDSDRRADFAVHGFVPGPRASVYTYGRSQDDAVRVGVGFPDVTLSSLGVTGENPVATLAPYSATVITLYPAAPAAARIINLSVRAVGGADSETLIAGYVVGGANTTGSLPLLVRGLGPTLGDYGVSGVMADPQLALHTRVSVNGQEQDSVAATNDNWGGGEELMTTFGRLGAVPLNSGGLDAALYFEHQRQGYSAHLNGKSGGGVAGVEVYDGAADPRAMTPRLINISGRAQVNTGDNVLIAGFVVSGSGPKTVLIRGIGPALAGYGVSGVLGGPRLQLHTKRFGLDTVLAENTAWGGDPALVELFGQVGAQPTLAGTPNSNDAALVVTLPPGIYSAVVSGVNDSTGVALVEIYEVE